MSNAFLSLMSLEILSLLKQLSLGIPKAMQLHRLNFHVARKNMVMELTLAQKLFPKPCWCAFARRRLKKLVFVPAGRHPCATRSSTKFHEGHVPDKTKPQLASSDHFLTIRLPVGVEKVHAVVAQSTWRSQTRHKLRVLSLFWGVS